MSWEDALARNPDDPRALLGLGSHLYEQEYFDDARELLKQAVARDAGEEPDNRRQARMLLAIIEHVTRNFGEAEKLVKEALALEPNGEDQPKLLFFLGRTYVSSGRQAEGVATFEVIVREYPQSPMAQKARETLVNMGRPQPDRLH
jgi:tetratricopeptide (TPR) repeat protein